MNRNLYAERQDLYKKLIDNYKTNSLSYMEITKIVNGLKDLDAYSGNKQEVNRLWDNVKNESASIQNEISEFIQKKFNELDTFIGSHDDSFFLKEHICITCGQKVPSDL